MDSNKIRNFAIITLAALSAVYLGTAAASAHLEAVAWVSGVFVLTVCLALGQRIWLLIPLVSSLGLVLPLPGNFSSQFLVQSLAIGFLTILFLMRKLPMQSRITELEIWNLLLIVCVLQVYLRNPVGLQLFGSSSVGAKPYVVFAVSTISALMISVLKIDPNDLKWWVRLSLIGSFGNFLIGAIGVLFPSVGYYLGASFSTDMASSKPQAGEGEATRISFVRGISDTLSLWISSRISLLKACFSPRWLPLVLFTIVAAAMSGFRSQLLIVALTYLIGVCYLGGLRSVIVSCLLGCAGIFLLAIVNLIHPLPPNIQRSLSFLPGTWSETVTTDAEGSTEWRVVMWKEALLTDRWIQNKWIGDGLGFTKAELDTMLRIKEEKSQSSARGALTSHQETAMISGGYHSGPVVTIRTIGYVGLLILLLGVIRSAVHAHRQILRCRNTEWYSTALFLCIPIIAMPFSWTFLYGSFEGGASGLIMCSALVRLMENNFPLPQYLVTRRQPYILNHFQEAHRRSHFPEKR